MKASALFLSRRLVTGSGFLALALLLAPSRSLRAAPARDTAPKPAEAAPAPVVIPSAVFADDPQTGKDPFFPESRRRWREVTPGGTNALAQPTGLLGQLVLKGISYTKGHRLALINNVTFAAGEKADLKINDQKVQVRCLDIRDRSALVTIEGTKETRELQLRKGL